MKNIKSSPESSNIAEILAKTLTLAKEQGATDAAVVVSHDEGFSVDVRMQVTENVAFHEDKSISVVVYYGQQKGSAVSTDLRLPALQRTVLAACDIAKVSAADPCFGLPDRALMQREHPDLALDYPWPHSVEDSIAIARECEQLALAEDNRISNSDGANFTTNRFYHAFANTAGGAGSLWGTRHSMSISLICEDKQGMQRDYAYATTRNPALMPTPQSISKEAVLRTVSRLSPKKIKTGKYPVVFSPRAAPGLIGSFISAISGGNLYRKNTFLLDSLHTQVFPEWVEIKEEPWILGGLGSAPFDGEGVPTRNNCFVENGRVQQYVLGSYAARRMGLTTSANSDGVHNLWVKANASSTEDLLKAMGTGLLVTELMGQGVNMTTGDYSRGAQGFWVEDGQIQYPVDEMTLASNLKDLFLSIAAISADSDPNYATRCGAIWVPEMTVGGR